MNFIERLRNNLQPVGELPVVRLDLNGNYFEHQFITECIDEAQRVLNRRAVQEPSALEKLALILLADSAYIERSK